MFILFEIVLPFILNTLLPVASAGTIATNVVLVPGRRGWLFNLIFGLILVVLFFVVDTLELSSFSTVLLEVVVVLLDFIVLSVEDVYKRQDISNDILFNNHFIISNCNICNK